MANSVVAPWNGTDYQARLFWIHASSLRDSEREDVVEVTFEADAPKAFDDVAVRYEEPGRQDSGPTRILADFYQIKFHVDQSGRFGYADLVDPAFIGAKKTSILQNLMNGKADHPTRAAFTLVTTDGFKDGDPLAKLVATKDGSLMLDRLFDGSTDRSAFGKVRKLWREHLGVDDDRLQEILTGFHIKASHDLLDRLRNEVNVRFRIVGLMPCEHPSEFKYDGAARALKVKGINRLTRASFEKLCREEGWISQTPPEKRLAVALRSFGGVIPADLVRASDKRSLVVTDKFDGRALKSSESWDEIFRQAAQFFREALEVGMTIRLFLDAHSSLAFHAGAQLGFKSGANVEIVQNGRLGPEVWNAKDDRPGPGPTFEMHSLGGSSDIALAVSLTRDSKAKVVEYISNTLPSVGTLFHVTAADGPGPNSVRGGDHAASIADAIARELSKVIAPGGVVHIFLAAPNVFSFYLGQHAEALGRCIPYEFDFGGRNGGSYTPTCEI